MVRHLYAPLIFSVLLFVSGAQADIAIVVHADSGISSLSRNEAVNIYMGRYRKFSSGTTALPVDLSPMKARFYRALVQKDLAEVNAYWARLIFSGQASPPQQVSTAKEITDIVRDNRGAIGYMDSRDVTADMQVVHTLPEAEH